MAAQFHRDVAWVLAVMDAQGQKIFHWDARAVYEMFLRQAHDRECQARAEAQGEELVQVLVAEQAEHEWQEQINLRGNEVRCPLCEALTVPSLRQRGAWECRADHRHYRWHESNLMLIARGKEPLSLAQWEAGEQIQRSRIQAELTDWQERMRAPVQEH